MRVKVYNRRGLLVGPVEVAKVEKSDRRGSGAPGGDRGFGERGGSRPPRGDSQYGGPAYAGSTSSASGPYDANEEPF